MNIQLFFCIVLSLNKARAGSSQEIGCPGFIDKHHGVLRTQANVFQPKLFVIGFINGKWYFWRMVILFFGDYSLHKWIKRRIPNEKIICHHGHQFFFNKEFF